MHRLHPLSLGLNISITSHNSVNTTDPAPLNIAQLNFMLFNITQLNLEFVAWIICSVTQNKAFFGAAAVSVLSMHLCGDSLQLHSKEQIAAVEIIGAA